jgi:hypothetical protein
MPGFASDATTGIRATDSGGLSKHPRNRKANKYGEISRMRRRHVPNRYHFITLFAFFRPRRVPK